MGPVISFTFDDGRANQVTPASKILEEFGFRGTFYVCPGLVWDARRNWRRPAAVIELASWAEIKEICQRGHEIGDHSLKHESFPYSKKTYGKGYRIWAENSTGESAYQIRKNTGEKEFSWAWPYHWFDDDLNQTILEHHTGIRPIEPRGKYNQTSSQKTYIKALNDYADWIIKEGIWGLAVIHDIETGRDPLPEYVLRKHLDYISSLDITVKTVSEVLVATRS